MLACHSWGCTMSHTHQFPDGLLQFEATLLSPSPWGVSILPMLEHIKSAQSSMRLLPIQYDGNSSIMAVSGKKYVEPRRLRLACSILIKYCISKISYWCSTMRVHTQR